MKVYITQEYHLPYAVVNSFWAAVHQHGYVADRIFLLTPKPKGALASRLAGMLAAVQSSYGIPPDVQQVQTDFEDPRKAAGAARTLIKAQKMVANQIAVDMTPGRTIPKLALFDAQQREGPVDHVFYLSVDDYDYRELPYPLVPSRIQHSRDLRKEVLDGH